MENIGSNIGHILVALVLFLVGVLVAKFLGIYAVGVLANVLYWGGRELAQSMRPGKPLKINWTLKNTQNFGYPVAVSVVLAVILTLTGF